LVDSDRALAGTLASSLFFSCATDSDPLLVVSVGLSASAFSDTGFSEGAFSWAGEFDAMQNVKQDIPRALIRPTLISKFRLHIVLGPHD
jgi:hypothetical protein